MPRLAHPISGDMQLDETTVELSSHDYRLLPTCSPNFCVLEDIHEIPLPSHRLTKVVLDISLKQDP